MGYTSDQKKEMEKLQKLYEGRGYENTAAERAKKDIDRQIKEQQRDLKKK